MSRSSYIATGMTAILLLIYTSCHAQDGYQERYTIGVRPLSIAIGGFEPVFEWGYSPGRAAQFACGYFSLTPPSGLYDSDVVRMRGVKLEVQLRRFTNPQTPKPTGFHYFPYLTYRQMWLTSTVPSGVITKTEEMHTASVFGLGLGAGYQLIIRGQVIVDLWAASGYILPLGKDEEEQIHIPFINPYQQAAQIRGGIMIGYLF